MRTFVLGRNGKALMPCHPARARQLLRPCRAVLHGVVPFVICLKDLQDGKTQSGGVKLAPGSKTTGIALVRERELVETDTGAVRKAAHVLLLIELVYSEPAIRDALAQWAAPRRRRRGASLRHRAPRFDNRPRTAGWFETSLPHLVETTLAGVNRLRR